jgi:hypothetical protein
LRGTRPPPGADKDPGGRGVLGPGGRARAMLGSGQQGHYSGHAD